MIWLNDRLVATEDAVIPVSDRSFLLGEGVFETIRTQNGESVVLDRHLKRLHKGATVLEFNFPKDDFISSAVSEVLNATKEILTGRMRITISGSGNLVITHASYTPWSEPAGVVTYPFPLN